MAANSIDYQELSKKTQEAHDLGIMAANEQFVLDYYSETIDEIEDAELIRLVQQLSVGEGKLQIVSYSFIIIC